MSAQMNRSVPLDLDLLKQRQILVTLVGQLAEAQFRSADPRHSDDLWQEAARLDLDPERITHLLYAGLDTDDRPGLLELDRTWMEAQPAPAWGAWRATAWLRRGQAFRTARPSGAHRSAPRAAAPVHR